MTHTAEIPEEDFMRRCIIASIRKEPRKDLTEEERQVWADEREDFRALTRHIMRARLEEMAILTSDLRDRMNSYADLVLREET